MLRTIREIQPRWVVGENVSGLINWDGGLVFEQVQADLEAQGYEVWANVLPAASVNAPHRRDRVWFVAFKNTNSDGRDCNKREEKSCIGKFGDFAAGDNEPIPTNNDEVGNVANATGQGLQAWKQYGRCENAAKNGTGMEHEFKRSGSIKTITNTDRSGRKELNTSYEPTRERLTSRTYFKRIPTWGNFPTQSPIRMRDDGLSSRLDAITFPKWRTESIKAGGNAIVPQVAYQIFKAINEYEKIIK